MKRRNVGTIRKLCRSAIIIWIWNGFSALGAVYHSDGSAASVQGLHNQLLNGDTITLPAGTFTWNRQVHITKNITLKGAGQNSTIVVDNVPKSGGLPGSILILCNNITGNLRITNFKIQGQAHDTEGWNKGTISISGTTQSLRVDNIYFDRPGTGAVVIENGVGVVDHCYFNEPNSQMGVITHAGNWGGVPYGDGSYDEATNLGSGRAVFIEDCIFIGNGLGGNGATDGYWGGRYVFRHNLVLDNNAGNHGTETPRPRGTRSFEIYQNTFLAANSFMDKAIYIRGGTGVIWGNSFHGADNGTPTGYKNAIAFDYFRSFQNSSYWGQANGSSAWDGNTDQFGYPALDQPGRGVCLDAVRGVQPINQRTGTAAWPRNKAEPVYIWSNDWVPVPNNPGRYISILQPQIRLGRDVINNVNTPMPGYVPYTYPHPLVNDSQPTPTTSTPIVTPTPSATGTPTSIATATASATTTPEHTPRPHPSHAPAP